MEADRVAFPIAAIKYLDRSNLGRKGFGSQFKIVASGYGGGEASAAGANHSEESPSER